MPADDYAAPADRALLAESADELYEEAPCGYLSMLPGGIIARVNQTFLDWTGYSRSGLQQDTRFQSLLTTGSKIYYETHFAPLLHMQGAIKEIALDIVRHDGRVLPVLVNARSKRDADGNPLLTRITVFDATDRRRYERELVLARRKAEQAARDKAELIAILSHDIRNPLNALMGVVQLLGKSELSEQQQRAVRLLKSSSDHMLTLLNRVLELSRTESSSFTAVERPFSLREEIEAAVPPFAASAAEKGVLVRTTLDSNVPPTVVGDPLALRQILTNLLGNAVKFTAEGSVDLRVKVLELATDGVTLGFEVADTGIGIEPGEVERIFDEYTQATEDTRARFGGSGLGLSITRKLLELYGSRVHVMTAPGQGSTFSFTLRLALPRAED